MNRSADLLSTIALVIGLGVAAAHADTVTLKADLKGGRNLAVTSLLKCIHDAVRGARSELDLVVDSPWGRQLAAIRSEHGTAPGRIGAATPFSCVHRPDILFQDRGA